MVEEEEGRAGRGDSGRGKGDGARCASSWLSSAEVECARWRSGLAGGGTKNGEGMGPLADTTRSLVVEVLLTTDRADSLVCSLGRATRPNRLEAASSRAAACVASGRGTLPADDDDDGAACECGCGCGSAAKAIVTPVRDVYDSAGRSSRRRGRVVIGSR